MRYLPDLPGKDAHLRMAPLHRVRDIKEMDLIPAGAVASAVLIVLIPSAEKCHSDSLLHSSLVVIRRNSYNGVHSGQISFPGGKYEPCDKDLIETACREAGEELGIREADVNILGLMTPLYVPPSNFVIYPVLSVAKKKIRFTPDPREVCGYSIIPLASMDPALSKKVDISVGNNSSDIDIYPQVPAYTHEDYVIWGATAMIISELYQFAEEVKLISTLTKR
ncbi:MAG: CoA pyrophosphatase [Bacteroidales bacterium]|nr:CoA pyrophosphatase [Bacteroidales bacterium]MDD2425534.1 CoA pyrophosphatase [Bacteroidales bacterium]MDD3989993.1 CoA pyrophosphatase [Bacteroidales bacterium]MDD4638177.1 CoA pyrophosphatase [Bacteroidales bacterium]